MCRSLSPSVHLYVLPRLVLLFPIRPLLRPFPLTAMFHLDDPTAVTDRASMTAMVALRSQTTFPLKSPPDETIASAKMSKDILIGPQIPPN